MPSITPDFSEAIEMSPIPAGVYKTRITGSELKTSQNNNEYINWKLQVFDADGDMSAVNGRTIYHRTMISGAGAGMLKQFVKAATGEVPNSAFDTDDILGREVEVTVAQKLDQSGEISNWPDVKAVRRI